MGMRETAHYKKRYSTKATSVSLGLMTTFFHGDYSAGDLNAYRAALVTARGWLDAMHGVVLVAHHGDGDGITGGALVGRYLKDRGCRIRYGSAPEFREKDLLYFSEEAVGCDAAVFVEAQGMPPEYSRLDALFINIDHHPHPTDTPIRRMLNPRSHDIEPNPAIGLVCWELLADAMPADAGWLAALASIVDYCPEPAASLRAQCAPQLTRLDDLRDSFLASQYVLPYTTDLAAFLSTLPSPDEFLAREPFAARRSMYRALLAEGLHAAVEGPRLVSARTTRGEFRIASPLANRLQDRHPNKCVVVVEECGDTARLSVRSRKAGVHLGRLLAGITTQIKSGDGTGHEKAGSARLPADRVAEFLRLLEVEIAR